MSENEKELKPDVVNLLKGIEDNPELRAYLMNQVLESSYEIERGLKKLPESIDARVKEQIAISMRDLREEINLIREAIYGLPSDLDQQVASMTSVVTTAHEETLKDVNLLEERIKVANAMALGTISEAMLKSTNIFEQNLIAAKNKVFDTAVSELHAVTEKYAKEHDAISKKLSVENASTTRQMAWVVIGATVVINLISIGVMFITR